MTIGEPAFFSVGAEAVVLRVKAKPHAREDAVLGVRAGELVVAVRAAAEKGKANAEIARVLAKALGVPRDRVALKSGAGAPHKVFVVPLEAAAVLRSLGAASS
jgi:uncharacterized protein YggU (UPF0235/DUF167 family)